jgi:rubrerythrin
VVAAEKLPPPQRGLGSVPESWLRAGDGATGDPRSAQYAVPGERAQGNDRAAPLQQCQLSLQIGEAVVALGGCRLVGGGRTAHDRGYVGVAEAQPVAAILGLGPVRVPGPVQGCVEPIAGAVAGEHPPGAVGAVGGWCQPNDRQASVRVAEAVKGSGPVVLSPEAAGRVCGAGLPPLDEPRAQPAAVNLVGKPLERVGLRVHRLRRAIMGPNRIMRGRNMRRGVIRRAAAVAVAGAAFVGFGCGGGSSSATDSEKAKDAEILNTALSQELTAVDAYTRGLPLLRGETLVVTRQFLTQEQEHVDGITRAIRGLGGKTEVEKNPLDYSGLETQADFLALAYDEENSLLAFYLNAIPKLETSAPRSMLIAITANEAEHLVVLRRALGARPDELVPEAFETGEAPAPGETPPGR